MRRPGSFDGPEQAIEFVPADLEQPLDLAQLFRNATAPLEVDLGCGDGLFLATRAAEYPARNFLGIERLIGRVRTSCRRISCEAISNARVVRVDITHAVRTLLPPESVDAFYLLFPDPWPKRRHQTRRIFNSELLRLVSAALRPGGSFDMATDQPEYFQEMKRVADASSLFAQSAGIRALTSTTFGQRFTESGAAIHRLALRKTSG